jgi:exo-beta-1,3-glucanase (GH17 family)
MSPPDRPLAAAEPPTARRRVAWLLLAAALALLLYWHVQRGRTVALPAAQATSLPCVSYAPFRRPGATPFIAALRVAPQDIESDLRLLAQVTGCVRLYGVDHGLDAVPAIARRLGLRVVLGAWIGRDPQANEAQLGRALELARAYRDVVPLLIVGNEVLLRGELAPEALAALLARARRASPVPVGYADVWAFWLRHAAVLGPHVDVVAAHVLPYWEDEPVAVERAVDHVHAQAARLRQAFGATPVWIAETGWPAAGRQRGAAVPGRPEQARFVRELLARQADAPLPFNLIEAFDQPWKRALEGAMGGAWGLFTAAGVPRVPLTGPLPPEPLWWGLPASAALGAVLMLAAGLRRRPSAAPALALGGAWVAACAWLQAEALPVWSRDGWEWAAGIGALLVSSLCGLAATARLAQWRGAASGAARRGLFSARGMRAPGWPGVLALAQGLLLCLAAVDALGLVFDGRYRPLPWPQLAAPAVLLLALAWCGDRLPATARAERLLAGICAACALLLPVLEGWANGAAWLYAGLLLALAAATLWPHRGARLTPGALR